MDLDDFRLVLESSGVDVWTFIDTAILVASLDNKAELKQRRDKIVERLYATSLVSRCTNCDFNGGLRADIKAITVEKESSPEVKPRGSPSTPQSINGDDDLDPYGGLFDDEQKRILEIKEHLEDPDQSEDSLVNLLQSLADMDITFKALKETDIGRHVNRLRKHPSNEVKRLVKHLVRKWKDIVDEWVRLNRPGEVASSTLMAYGDSPQQKISQNGHHQVPDFAYSPNPHNGNISEPERKPEVIPIKETPAKPNRSPFASGSAPQSFLRQREQKDSTFDSNKLASATKRLQDNYKEAENAKRQRTIQVMDIHEIPKPKNAFFGKNRGSGGSHGRHR
ncbi:Transcription elongation factor (TFIIS) family protein putative isoform 1 [Tripterygium wilfordii]|uniref:Transcription elongation factor (TFIIS) family protein putative isoform 1 n=1 Tax=Tripterygium wilfordii TaxID=458696 RepID=A0A7J7DFW9_TRIWF|nr:probable mediator of RNA polymerase II transcription subunit 26c [Tripterygium wilfordii]KAF5745169.1 Transcription elongation factor (TFIIS) family protein putative isoform 1 [Tripterygium wilfordii]